MQTELRIDMLFAALTRPATTMGVPYGAVVSEVMLVTILFLAVGNPLAMLLLIPTHGVLYLISAHDPNMFRVWWMWIRTNGRCRTTRFWEGAASYAPQPLRKWPD